MTPITDVKIQQEILLEGLLHLKQLCEKHHLRYFLCNGSLLGAVKYGRFIPWDDDADIMMPREDYEKLIRLTEADSEDFRLLSRARTPAWKMPFAKLSHNHTIQKEGAADFGCEIGVNVDIFPIDSWPANIYLAKLQASFCRFLRRMISSSVADRFITPKTGISWLILICLWTAARVCGSKFFVRIGERLGKNAGEGSPYCGCVVWAAYGDAEIMDKEQFSEQSTVTFCGHSFTTFRDPESYLRSLYGDYRKDPPPEKQKSNHLLKVFYKN